MSNTFIQEAFQNAYLVEDAEEFSLNVSGPNDVESFLDVIDGGHILLRFFLLLFATGATMGWMCSWLAVNRFTSRALRPR